MGRTLSGLQMKRHYARIPAAAAAAAAVVSE